MYEESREKKINEIVLDILKFNCLENDRAKTRTLHANFNKF